MPSEHLPVNRLWRPASLQAQLTGLVLVSVLLLWLAAAVAVVLDARHELDELLDGHLAQAAALLVLQDQAAFGELGDRTEHDDEGEHHHRQVDAQAMHRYAPQVAFQVFHEGRLVLRSAQAPLAPMVPPGTGRRIQMPDGATTGFRASQAGLDDGLATVQIDGVAWRVFAARGAERDVQVVVGEQLPVRRDILRAVLRSMLWPLLLLLPLLALAVAWAARQGTGPLRRLGEQLGQRRPDALQPVAMPDAPTEMRPLLQAMNGLFGRIGQLLDSERRFTADAAHELRTPIAAIRTQAQVALGALDAAERQHALQATLAGCDRATRLVAQLLTLSRLEAAAAPAAAAGVNAATRAGGSPMADLAATTRQVLAELAPQALDRDQQLSLEGADGPDGGKDSEPGGANGSSNADWRVAGDAALLAVLVRNLVDNALRYSPDGATVQVRLLPASPASPAGAGNGPVLQVQDSGPGLEPAQCQRLGERFFRVLGSGQDGSGLGWSIVRRIAAVQGATVQVGRAEPGPGGLSVTVGWPRCEA